MAVSNEAMWPYMAKYLNDAFDWAEKAPESDPVYLGMHIGKIEVCIDGELIGHIHTGDEMRFEPVPLEERS
jgi:hypothetical protein